MTFIEHILKYFGYIKADNKSLTSSHKEDNSILPVESAAPTPAPVSIDKFALAYIKGARDIQFEKIGSNLIPSEYRCVPMDRQSRQELYNALSTGAGIASFGASAYPLTGLYKATASAGELMKLSSGGVGSSVIGANGKIVAQKGFIQVGPSTFTPMIAFQLMSFVTGQYYLNGINKQLKAIDAKLDFIIKELEAEKQGKINSAVLTFRMMAEQRAYSLDDLIVTRMKMTELLDLYCFYITRMEEEYSDILSKKRDISNWTNCGDVEEMKAILEKTKFFEYNGKAQYCYQTYSFGQLLYLKMLAFSINQDLTAKAKFEEIVYSFKGNDNILKKSFERHKSLFEQLRLNTETYIKKKGDEASSFKDSLKAAKSSIINEFKKENLILENEAIKEIRMMQSEIVRNFESPSEMLYQCSDNGEVYVFCLDKK